MGILARYAALLPVTPATPPVNLEEGSTPLIALPRIGEKLGITLYGKFEGCNPSGSFKDRGMVLAVAKALEEGKRHLYNRFRQARINGLSLGYLFEYFR
mgnify:CR=1 FL=1